MSDQISIGVLYRPTEAGIPLVLARLTDADTIRRVIQAAIGEASSRRTANILDAQGREAQVAFLRQILGEMSMEAAADRPPQ